MYIKKNQLTPLPSGIKIKKVPSSSKQARSIKSLQKEQEEKAKEESEAIAAERRAETRHEALSEDGRGYEW